METAATLLNNILICSLGIWAVTTGYLLVRVRASKIDPTAGFTRNKFWPDVDIRFFKNLRILYAEISCELIVPKVNAATQHITIFGFIAYFVLCIAIEMSRY